MHASVGALHAFFPPKKENKMGWFRQNYEQSLLGQLLVKQELVSEEQLARAIDQQSKTG